jgi:hypothetical protein
MPTPESGDSKLDPVEQGEKRGARVAVGIFVVLSSVFVVSSTWQLSSAVLFLHDPASSLREPPVDPRSRCAADLRGLTGSVERAITASTTAPNDEAATRIFAAGLAPEWDREDAVLETCTAEPHGLEAFAVVSRLRRAGGAFARHRASDLAKAHEDVSAALGSPLPP